LAEKYAGLDNQILPLVEQQDQVLLSNPARAGLKALNEQPLPAALMARALRHEGVFYGALWVAYKEPHQFSKEEISFITTVADQAALAAANARVYMTASLGRQRLEAILASSPDPVLVTDQHGQLLLANPAAHALFSNGKAAKVGISIEQVVKQPELLKLMQARQGEILSVEVHFGDGRVYYATASSVLAEGQFMGRVCVLNDITYYKELDALKSEFVATVSHDLRSPLTLMRGYATMLQMVGDLNEQQAGYVSKIVLGVESMSRLVNNLLDLGRIEAGVGLQVEMLPVLDIVRQVIEALQIQAAQKQIDLKLEVPERTMPLIEADQALLQQAIHNLVENAVKYTEPGGKVDVKVTVGVEEVVFSVIDNGIGIAPVDLPRLFERFYRGAGRQARKQRGSGLGLAIVKSIAEKHGGSVRVESKLGQGSAFYLTIPLRQPEKPA
jgi:PAS domain S-box-containing protein